MTRWSKPILVVVCALFCTAVFAVDIPLRNWTPVPWTGSAAPTKSGPLRNIGTNNWTTSFMPLTPCRMYDTRSFGPATPLAGGTSITVNPNGTYPSGFTPCAGIPSGAAAYSINITVFGSVANGSFAFLTAYPTGTTRPSVSTMNFSTGSQTSNAAVIASGTSGSFDVYTTYTTNFTIDINGYYTLYQNSTDGFASSTASGYGVYGLSGSSHGVVGYTNGGSSAAGVYGTTANGRGVWGASTNYNGVWADSTNWDAFAGFGGRDGGYFQGARNGAIGVSTASTGLVAGLTGSTTSTTAGAAGVVGTATASPTNYNNMFSGPVGILGLSTSWYALGSVSNGIAAKFINTNTAGTISNSLAYLGGSTYSAALYGDVQINSYGSMAGNLAVTGTVSKGGGSFKIDDPIDPENKYLYHSFVESPDMMNIYNGNVELDQNGEATVQLPAYFEALNRDFRYQLTSIGRPQPDLYIADEVANNMFRIAGGRGHAKVSWTVTGIRHDPFANAHRIPNEIDKDPAEKGTYLHPAEWGQPADRGLQQKMEKTMDGGQQVNR